MPRDTYPSRSCIQSQLIKRIPYHTTFIYKCITWCTINACGRLVASCSPPCLYTYTYTYLRTDVRCMFREVCRAPWLCIRASSGGQCHQILHNHPAFIWSRSGGFICIQNLATQEFPSPHTTTLSPFPQLTLVLSLFFLRGVRRTSVL